MDSTTKSPYGRTVVNQYLHRIVEAAGQRQISDEYLPLLWRSTHCRGRRKVEEYSSSEVPDSDNNSIKESVKNFLSPLSERILQNLLWKSLRKLTFPLLAGSYFRTPLPSSEHSNSLQVQNSERERRDFRFGVFRMRNWSAIYNAPGGANGSEPNERLQRFGLNRCNGSTQQLQLLAVQLEQSQLLVVQLERFGSG